MRRIKDSTFDCTVQHYGGFGSGVRPLLEFDNLLNWNQEYDWVPFLCKIRFDEIESVAPQAAFCDIKKDKDCTIGCKPSENYPECLPNPNYVRPEETPAPAVDSVKPAAI